MRGVFGLALRRMSKGEEPVPDLPDEFACPSLYNYFFGELLPSTSSHRTANRKAPRPYVIDLPPTPTPSLLAEGDLLAVGFCLIGRANLVLDAVVSAFDRGAAIGLGATRGHARLLQVAALWHADPGDDRIVWREGDRFEPPTPRSPLPPPSPRTVRLSLRAPLRLSVDERIVRPEDFTAGVFLMSLVRRLSRLMYFYGSCQLDINFRDLKAKADAVPMSEARLRWARQRRYSGNQGQDYDVSGLIGSFVLDLAGREELWPYIWLGNWVQAGKGTVFGLGAYEIEAA